MTKDIQGEQADSRQKILVVDDEASIRRILETRLKMAGYNVVTAEDGEEAVELFNKTNPDIVILDVMMPKMDGYGVTREIRRVSDVPIIILTALGDVSERITGLELGADDYISKPFSVRELMARIRAVLARTAVNDKGTTSPLIFEGLTIDLSQRKVMADGEILNLTKTELELLRLLLSHKGQVFSRQQLLSEVWPSDVIVTNRTVDVNITRLRKKLGHYGQHIATRQGYGYLFDTEGKI